MPFHYTEDIEEAIRNILALFFLAKKFGRVNVAEVTG